MLRQSRRSCTLGAAVPLAFSHAKSSVDPRLGLKITRRSREVWVGNPCARGSPLLKTATETQPLTDAILDEMTSILGAAQRVALCVHDAQALAAADQEAVLLASNRISPQADVIIAWLLETPLETSRH
jgi:hypothetical protein